MISMFLAQQLPVHYNRNQLSFTSYNDALSCRIFLASCVMILLKEFIPTISFTESCCLLVWSLHSVLGEQWFSTQYANRSVFPKFHIRQVNSKIHRPNFLSFSIILLSREVSRIHFSKICHFEKYFFKTIIFASYSFAK